MTPKASPLSRNTVVHEPEDWPWVFERHVNAGDLEEVMALYAPDASFVPAAGDIAVGHDEIRRQLSPLIATKAQFQAKPRKVVAVGDVALLYTDWIVRTVDPSGTAEEASHSAIEVVRRQPDGTWKLIVGDPNGRRSTVTARSASKV